MLETSTTAPRTAESRQAAGPLVAAWERAAISALIVAVLLASSLPYLYAYLAQREDRVFSGIVFNVPDNVQYQAWLRDHRSGLLVANRMTPEPNEPLLFNALWLVIARLSVVTGVAAPVLFHGLRLLVGAAALLLLYPFCRLFTRAGGERLSAYLMIALGGGLGWIWVIDKYLQGLPDVRFPLDLYVAEPNLYFNIMAFPHFVIAALLIVAIFWCYLEALRRRSWWYAAAAAALGLVLTLQHAYDLLIIGCVPAGALALMALRDRRIPWFGGFALGLIGAVATPPAVYFTLLTSRDPLWREILDQFSNAGVFTPPPHHLLVLMGVPLLAALAGVGWAGALLAQARGGPLAGTRAALESASDADLLLWAWFVIGFLLLYIPTDFQIHMLNTWQIPVALIAARAVYRRLLPRFAPTRPRVAWAAPLMLLLVLPGNLYLTAWRVVDLGRQEAPYFHTADEARALGWLDQHAGRADVVLAGLNVGQFVPARSDARTFLGHWAQTVAYYDKHARVRAFFDAGTTDATRRALLEQFAVSYVIYGREERSLGAYDPGRSPLFAPVFAAGEVTIYRVRGR